MKNLKYNELKILLLQVLTWITFSSALIIPFYFSNWVLNTDVFLLFWIYQIVILLFEIPTWLFSSQFWERVWLSVGYIFMFLFFILLSFWESFLYFALLQFILAISKAFQSWSVNSLIYDYAIYNKLDHKKLRADYQILWLIIWLFTTLIWSFLVLGLWYSLIFYIEAILFLLASFYVLSFKLKETYEIDGKKSIQIFKDSIVFLKNNRNIMFSWLILYFLLWLEAWIYISIQEVYLNELKLPLEYLWLVISMLTISSIIFTKIISRKDYKYINILLLLSLLTFLISSGLNYYFTSIIVFITFFITQIVRWVNIIIDDKILSKIDNWIWSSVISLLGFSERLIFFTFSLIVFVFKINALLLIFILSILLLFIYYIHKIWANVKIVC